MSQTEIPVRRRPVPPPKTDSQAQLRKSLSPGPRTRPQEESHQNQVNEPYDVPNDPPPYDAVSKQEAAEHIRLPPGWSMRNDADVTYHTHMAEPVVHETIHRDTVEVVEPKITRDIHRYHQYDYVQPLEVVAPDQSYATNARGEIIHAPGGLNTVQSRQESHWEQHRQDKGYGLTEQRQKSTDGDSSAEDGKTVTTGPFPLQSEYEGARVLREIREGGIARSFGGNMTSSLEPLSHPLPATPAGEIQTSSRRSGMGQVQASPLNAASPPGKSSTS